MKTSFFFLLMFFLISGVYAYGDLAYGFGCYGSLTCNNHSAEEDIENVSVEVSGSSSGGSLSKPFLNQVLSTAEMCEIYSVCTDWSACVNETRFRDCFSLRSDCVAETNTENLSCAREEALFDISVNLLESLIENADSFSFSVGLVNLGSNKSVPVELNYLIFDSNNSLVFQSAENITVDVQLEFLKKLDNLILSEGNYNLVVDLSYPGQKYPARSVNNFVVKSVDKKNMVGGSLIFFLILALTVFLVLLYEFRRKFAGKSLKIKH